MKNYLSTFIGLFILFFVVKGNSQISFQESFGNLSFNFPVEIQPSIDGSDRLFVVEQPGRIRVFPNKSNVTSGELTTFLDISDIVSYSAGQEIGLLGLAFHPNYATNGYVYIYYIDRPNNYRINIARYQVNPNNPDQLDPNSATIIAQFIKNQTDSNHNGGKIAFGLDGYLYISVGDGGGGGDPQGNGQNLNTVFGSILRIDIDVDGNNPIETNAALPNGNYEIPSNNPRVGLSGLDELYAWGIRNTWKFSFDVSGNLWGADVGQNSFEEINLITRGGNFGWNKFEATSEPSYGRPTNLVTNPDIKPIFSYDHSASDVSITGGYIYKGSLTSNNIQDKYIYGDYVSGRVWALNYNAANGTVSNELLFKTNGQFISSFGEDESGELYFSDYGSNVKLYKLTETVSGPVTTAVNGVGEWEAVTSGTNGIVQSVTLAENETIYVGGTFNSAGGSSTNNFAVLDENLAWQNAVGGSNGVINTIATAPDGSVYAAGDFETIGGINANNIAKWDGTSWSALGAGTNGPVLKIAFNSSGELFVGGVFTSAGGQNVNNIGKWESNTWSPLTDNTTNISGTNNEIRSIGFDENNMLYVGGNFDTAGGNPATRIAQWNGSSWSALGTGTSGFVQAIESIGDYLYVGGNFALAGNTTVNRIARFNKNNQTWESLGNGLSGNVNAITTDGSYIYVGGTFETASDTENNNKIVNNIARWSLPNGWEALGTNTNVGVNIRVNTLTFTADKNQLIVGGNFSTAGTINANNIALWNEEFCSENSITPVYTINDVSENGKNSIQLNEGDSLILSLLPLNSSYVLTLPNGSKVNGEYTLTNVTTAQSGTYVFETNLGCTESIEVTVVSTTNTDEDNDGVLDVNDVCPNTPENETVNASGCSNDQLGSDTDGDGVPNNIDLCPDTLVGEIVDANGCANLIYPADQFRITTRGTSCLGADNGSIRVESKTSDNFNAVLKGATKEVNFTFSGILDIPNLDRGSYDLCITSTNFPNYLNCSKFIITEPEPLDVQLNFDSFTNSITLKMKGSGNFNVDINGKTLKTSNSELILPLYEEVNNVKITTDQQCQGTFEETVVLENSIVLYPNPVKESLTIDLSSVNSPTIEITLFTASGAVINSQTYEITEPNLTLDTHNLASGLYFIRLKNQQINKSYKLIKL